MGKYAGYELPSTFSKFSGRDVIKNTRRLGFTTVFDEESWVFKTNNEIQSTKYNLEKLLRFR